MAIFVGWIPTVAGRLSFSRIGDDPKSGREVCNNTYTLGGRGFLFASEVRTSRDGALPAWFLRCVGGIPDTHFLAFLRTSEAALPRPASPVEIEDSGCAISLESDPEGALFGDVIFFSQGKLLSPDVERWLSEIRQLARASRVPTCDQTRREQNFQRAAQLGEEIWGDMKGRFEGQKKAPAFGRLQVQLLRTGQVNTELDEAALYTTDATKSAQAAVLERGGKVDPSSSPFETAAAAAARQTFFFLRDLAHRHYHHHPHSDLLIHTYPWDPEDDDTWRRETQYGLARLVIAARRRDTAEAYKEALGLIAYASAFQRHLCGWVVGNDGRAAPGSWKFAYDFEALRLSIDASLKVRELRDAQARQSWIFVFGFLITSLGLVVSGLRTNPRSPTEPSLASRAVGFTAAIDWLTVHPIISLMGAVAGAYLFDTLIVRYSVRPRFFAAWPSGLSRFTEAALGSARQHAPRWFSPAWFSYLIVLVLLALIVTAFALAFVFAVSGILHIWP